MVHRTLYKKKSFEHFENYRILFLGLKKIINKAPFSSNAFQTPTYAKIKIL